MYILLIVYNFFCLFVHIENFIEDIFKFITRKSIGGGVHFNFHYIIFIYIMYKYGGMQGMCCCVVYFKFLKGLGKGRR